MQWVKIVFTRVHLLYSSSFSSSLSSSCILTSQASLFLLNPYLIPSLVYQSFGKHSGSVAKQSQSKFDQFDCHVLLCIKLFHKLMSLFCLLIYLKMLSPCQSIARLVPSVSTATYSAILWYYNSNQHTYSIPFTLHCCHWTCT